MTPAHVLLPQSRKDRHLLPTEVLPEIVLPEDVLAAAAEFVEGVEPDLFARAGG